MDNFGKDFIFMEWWVHGEYMGKTPRFSHPYRHGIRQPYAVHWFCQGCGTIWAKRVPVFDNDKVRHVVLHAPCKHCGGNESMQSEILFQDVKKQPVPFSLLKREVMIACADPEQYVLPQVFKGHNHE